MTKFRKFFLIIFFVALIWLMYSSYNNWSSLTQIQLTKINYEWFILAFCFTALDNFFDYKSWIHYLKRAFYLNNKNLKHKILPNIFIASFASDLLPAKMGTFSRPFILKEILGLRMKEGISVHLNALFSDFFAAMLICFVGLFYWGYTLFNIFIVLLCFFSVMLTIILILRVATLQGYIQRTIRLFFPAESVTGIIDLQNSIYNLFTKQDFFITLTIKLCSWIAMGLCLYSVVKALDYNILLIECIFMVTISSILGMLSFLPGGLIVAEASLLGFFLLLNIPINTAIITIFIYRIFSFWEWVILGNLVVQFYLPKTITPHNKPLI